MSETAEVLVILTLLQVKHLVADFWLQPAWMIEGKKRYGDIGGLAHAGLHAVLTLAVFWVMGSTLLIATALAAAEAIVHYHIDWFKSRQTTARQIGPDDPRFWHLLGLDQFAHQVTYLGLAGVYLLV